MRTYWKVALLGWQDSLVYRFNALIWVLYAVVPALTLMLVWLAAYNGPHRFVGGYSLSGMMTYYLLVTGLAVAITPNPEWDIAQTIRDGKLTPYLLRPLSYFGYRVAWESSYQIVKTAMMLPKPQGWPGSKGVRSSAKKATRGSLACLMPSTTHFASS